ncbi:MAG: helix-turn-helix domain-containing protein, partial [Prochlorothrix sp.]
MAPSKLSEEDKQEIFHRYRNTDETTSTLAKQFGVSVSTISRFLKSQLSPTEYDDLVRQKRLAGGRSGGDNDTGNDTGTATTNESSVSTGDRTEQMEQADGANEAEAQPAEATPVTATETTDWDAADPGAGELTGAEVTGAESIASAPIPAPRAAGL